MLKFSVPEYAKKRSVTPEAVRYWIKKGRDPLGNIIKMRVEHGLQIIYVNCEPPEMEVSNG